MSLEMEHEGYIIRWSEFHKCFCIHDKETDEVATKKLFHGISESQEWIDNKNKVTYQPVAIIAGEWRGPRRPGKATSPVDGDHAWITLDNPKARAKAHMNAIWLDTPDNRRILDEVTTKQAQITNLEKEVKALEDLAVKLTIDDFNVDGREA